MSRKPRNASAEIREAATRACAYMLLKSDLKRDNAADIYVLRNVLKELIWTHTGNHEEPGYYEGCPWWTREALEAYDNDKYSWKKLVALEHVVERKSIAQKLLEAKSEEDIRQILMTGETCVVLRAQHKLLGKGEGWSRYAGLDVLPGPKARKRLEGTIISPPNLG